MTDMTINQEAYETIHALHTDYAKPSDQCLECTELKAQHEESINAMIDQGIEDKYHNHLVQRR